MRWMFYVEREFHASLMTPLAEELRRRDAGEMGVWSPVYHTQQVKGGSIGARPDVLRRAFGGSVELIEDPDAWSPDVTFTADTSYENIRGDGLVVDIGHGTICKGSFFTGGPRGWRYNCADLVCTPGEAHREALLRRAVRPIIATGMPKLDSLFAGRHDRTALLHAWGLDPANKTVLVAPTYNREYSLLPHTGCNLRRWIPAWMNIVVKLHAAAPAEWLREFGELAAADDSMHLELGDDIAPCLAVADATLSDVSSVVFESLAAGRPTLAFNSPDREQHPRYDPADLEWRWRNAARVVERPEQIEEQLFRALSEPPTELAVEAGERFLAMRDGTSSARVIDAALDVWRQHRRDATAVIYNVRPGIGERLYKRCRTRCNVLAATDAPAPEWVQRTSEPLRMHDLLACAAQLCRDDLIIFIDADWRLSPCCLRLLVAHLRSDASLGVVAPLLPRGENPEQDITRHIPQTQDLPPERIVGPLTWHTPGETKPVRTPRPVVFATRRALLPQASGDLEQSWEDWLDNVRRSGSGLATAMDCFAWKG